MSINQITMRDRANMASTRMVNVMISEKTLADMQKEIQDLKDYIIEYELLGGEVKPLSPSDDRLSIL